MRDSRERIIDAARALYLRGGAGAVSMRKVAERVELVASAIYRHFPDKKSLLREIVEEGRREFARRLDDAGGRTAATRLRAAFAAYLEFAIERPHEYRALFTDAELPRARTFPEGFKSGRAESTFALLLELAGSLDAALAIWAQAHGLAMLWLAGHFGRDAAAFRKHAMRSFDLLLEGVR